MLERDGKIETALAKGEELNVQTYKYKKTASATRSHFWKRKIWQWVAVVACVIIAIIILLAILGVF